MRRREVANEDSYAADQLGNHKLEQSQLRQREADPFQFPQAQQQWTIWFYPLEYFLLCKRKRTVEAECSAIWRPNIQHTQKNHVAGETLLWLLWYPLRDGLVPTHSDHGPQGNFDHHEECEFKKSAPFRKRVRDHPVHQMLLQWEFPIASHSSRLPKNISEW